MAKSSMELRDEIYVLLNAYRGEKLHGRCIWAVMKRVETLRKRGRKTATLKLVKSPRRVG